MRRTQKENAAQGGKRGRVGAFPSLLSIYDPARTKKDAAERGANEGMRSWTGRPPQGYQERLDPRRVHRASPVRETRAAESHRFVRMYCTLCEVSSNPRLHPIVVPYGGGHPLGFRLIPLFRKSDGASLLAFNYTLGQWFSQEIKPTISNFFNPTTLELENPVPSVF